PAHSPCGVRKRAPPGFPRFVTSSVALLAAGAKMFFDRLVCPHSFLNVLCPPVEGLLSFLPPLAGRVARSVRGPDGGAQSLDQGSAENAFTFFRWPGSRSTSRHAGGPNGSA